MSITATNGVDLFQLPYTILATGAYAAGKFKLARILYTKGKK